MNKKRLTKKSTATRTTAKQLPRPPRLQTARATKLAEPFVDEIQRAVDEQTMIDFGLKPQSPKQAAAFRARVAEMGKEPRRRKL